MFKTLHQGLQSSQLWWLKIAAKVILHRLPVSYRIWQKLGVFKAGAMARPEYALNTVLTCAGTGQVLKDAHRIPTFVVPSGTQDYGVLELGPGDSLFTALISMAMGASRTWMVDSSRLHPWK